MKRILIFSHAMEIGGAEKALLGLLEAINKKAYQVDLFLMRHEGELMQYIPDGINILPEIPQYTCLAVPFGSVLKKGQLGMACGRFVGKILAAKKVKKLQLPKDNDVALQYSHKCTLTFLPAINKNEYDLAISFLTPHYIVSERIMAKRKIAWIHTDYSTVAVDRNEQLLMWEKYDWIASISEGVTNSFLKVFPELSAKVILLPNIMPIDYMLRSATEFKGENEMPQDGSIRLLSIGRFCTAKNFDNVAVICKMIRRHGHNVKWYLIGYGQDEEIIKKQIIKEKMEKYVILLGKKSNPYPYIKSCDLYVQPSRYEGKCVSVIEAQIFHKPVVITAYSTSDSQLKNGYDGVVVPMDNCGCAEGIVALLRNKDMQKTIVENTKRIDYSNMQMIFELYRIMES